VVSHLFSQFIQSIDCNFFRLLGSDIKISVWAQYCPRYLYDLKFSNLFAPYVNEQLFKNLSTTVIKNNNFCFIQVDILISKITERFQFTQNILQAFCWSRKHQYCRSSGYKRQFIDFSPRVMSSELAVEFSSLGRSLR